MAMSSLTCITCRVYFVNTDCQKDHYKSEWHQYNLKRKVVNLDAIDFDSFTKLKQNQIDLEKKREKKQDTYCKYCRKLFANEKALEQHFQSRKHKDLQVKFNFKNDPVFSLSTHLQAQSLNNPSNDLSQVNSDSEEWYDVEDDEDILTDTADEKLPPLNQCLFCSNFSQSIEENVKHMSKRHSFFIPDVDFLIDLNSLLKYLAKKIYIYHQCLWCNDKGKAFYSFQAVQNHMISKGHSKIQFESSDVLLEYSPFYDYSSSYPDDGNDPDEEITINEIDGDNNCELMLPSGSVIGHRSLFKYYKQNLRPLKDNVSSEARKKVLDKVISGYRSLGWNETTCLTAIKRAKDIKCFNRYMSKRSLNIGLKHNKTLRLHFKSQIFF